jgi:hypothetical protein
MELISEGPAVNCPAASRISHRAELYAEFVRARRLYRGNTTLDPKHAELAYLTATVINNYHY